ncbi:riboflavin biosynthesis protein RibF [Lactobacillus sp. Sy-1]|uniref:riboflavin biosynthesis protein RibF n=1 Tax=Lactobacillus sp. Sy-1 TaxID=2109645 RepID=UPI001C59862F|nr:riboflavin biosynthesis protein RibF [Lactobacillus sp. Sy-1]MBW1605494.1 riboflavin biosynthesis protein RibF [Lactobacillus sp. Sy-1]
MEIFKIHHPMGNLQFNEPVVLAMGFFDGLHLGHQRVIERAKQIADQKGVKLAVLTYDHHPSIVYQRLSAHDKRYLTLNDYKMDLLEQMGVQVVFQVSYTNAFQAQSPQQFVDNYLCRLNALVVVAGFDHTYGEKKATMHLLPEYVKDRFEVVEVASFDIDNKKVSSTRIRRNLDAGHIDTVNRLLGRPFVTSGTIVHGFARGRELGYPTANVEHSEYQWLPAIGIYIVRMQIGDQWYGGMASIGRNVTFGDAHPITVEINLFNFNQNIYGEDVQIEWLHWTRGEVKFNGVDALIKQLQADQKEAEKFLSDL